MRGKGMAQTVDAASIRQPRPFHRPVKDALARRIDHRLLRVTSGRKQPVLRSTPLPIPSQLLQQPWRKKRVAVFLPLALHHTYLLTLGIEVFGLEMTSLVEPQTRAIDGHQKGPMPGMHAPDREEPFQFADAEHLRAPNLVPGPRH